MSIIICLYTYFYHTFSRLASLFKNDCNTFGAIKRCRYAIYDLKWYTRRHEDMLKVRFLIHLIIITKNEIVTLCIEMWITCTADLCHDICPMASLNGILQTILQKNWLHLFLMIQKLDIFLEFIYNIQNIYINYIMRILFPLRG